MTIIAHPKYHILDGIRGVASLLIVLRHTGEYFGKISFAESYLAVDLFFVLSGFVVAVAYNKRLADGLTSCQFVKIRLIRLYPLYLLGAVLGILYYISGILRGHNDFSIDFIIITILAIFMLPSPLTANLYPTNDPSWSLMFELISNGLYSTFHLKLTTKFLLIIMSVSGVLLGFSAYKIGSLDAGFLWKDFHIGLARVFYSFSAGLLIYKIQHVKSIVSFPSWLLILLILVFLCYSPSTDFRAIYDLFTVTIIFPTVVYFSSTTELKSGVLTKIYAFLGAISYAIYVLHVPISKFITDGSRGFLRLDVAQFAPLSGALLLLGLVIISWGIDAIYDRPIRRKANELFYTSKNIVKLGK